METFSALLAICAGNSPVLSEFPAQRPVTRSFEVFFDLRLNKRLSKQSWRWCFEMLSLHYDVTVMQSSDRTLIRPPLDLRGRNLFRGPIVCNSSHAVLLVCGPFCIAFKWLKIQTTHTIFWPVSWVFRSIYWCPTWSPGRACRGRWSGLIGDSRKHSHCRSARIEITIAIRFLRLRRMEQRRYTTHLKSYHSPKLK